MKLIFVTGGVMSGIGKGITAASIGRLIKNAGYSVTMMKMDPYLQIDAGTMSPYEHGETFVTLDGFETDLDLGHYERFVDEDLTRQSSLTTGQIYLSIITKERKGEFLGKTVQVIPHVINEIKDKIYTISQGKDVTIIEIGGTVGDIEGPHFLEAMRQLRMELGREGVMFVHVAPVLNISNSGELKTKAIQHSIIKLREVGIHANILVCRSSKSLDESLKAKLALFCDIKKEHIIEGIDQNIYQVALSFKNQGLDKIITGRLFGSEIEADMSERERHVNNLINPEKEITIGIAGKYTNLDDCYISVLESLKHAGAHFKAKIKIVWLETEQYQTQDRESKIIQKIQDENIKGILVPGGFGDRGVEGMINIANFCREKNIPYLGLCLGLQIAVVSFARKVCELLDANSTEFNTKTQHPVITIMEDQINVENKGGTMRLGSYNAVLEESSKTIELYRKYYADKMIDNNTISERHRHRYEVNPLYHGVLEEKGISLSGKSADGRLVEFIEIPGHKFYMATQAHPEFKSRINKPHPLFLGFIENCIH